MNLEAQLNQIESRRQHKNWEVMKPVGSARTLVHPTIYRCLCLRFLEIPVKEWTQDYMAGSELGTVVVSILDSHSRDEDKHDAQLEILAEYWRVPLHHEMYPKIQDTADQLSQRWMSLDTPAIVKKMALECGVFFPILGMLAKYAPEDLFTQSVREWITSDENAHVASSRLIVKALGLRISVELQELVRETIEFLVDDKDEGTRKMWHRLSSRGLRTGSMGDELGISVVSVPEAFTQTNNHRIPYQSHGVN